MTGRVRTGRLSFRTGGASGGLWLGVAAAIFLSLAASPLAAGSAAGTDWSSSDLAWTNGVTLCVFAGGSPTVSVSALSVAGSGLSVSFESITEVGPSGAAVGTASLTSASWTVQNASTPDEFDMSYRVQGQVVAPNDSSRVLGSVDVAVDYLLPAYSESPGTNLESVTEKIVVSNWTWQGAGDRLVLNAQLWPTYSALERISNASGASGPLTSVALGSSTVRESLSGNRTANVSLSSGGSVVVPVTPEVTVLSGGTAASVALSVGSGGGAFRSVAYSLLVGVYPPGVIAGVPLYELVVAGGTGSAIVAILGFGARRLRRRPSDLVFAEEET